MEVDPPTDGHGFGDDEEQVRSARAYATAHLSAICRGTGETYADHCREVTETLREIVPNPSLLRTALLHGICRHADCKQLLLDAPLFSSGEAALIKTLSEACDNPAALHWPQKISMHDPRLALLFAAHSLNDVRRMSRLPEPTRKKMCKRALTEIAVRLRESGLMSWAKEMEDRCFMELQPEEATILQTMSKKSHDDDIALLEHVMRPIRDALDRERFEYTMEYRIKSLYSTYKKLQSRYDSLDDFHDLHDRLAVRILCADDETCYEILAVIHRLFTPVSSLLKDYIAAPKNNGYRSLHTVVMPDVSPHKPVEVQIRSDDMHWQSLYGPAQHGGYKASRYAFVS